MVHPMPQFFENSFYFLKFRFQNEWSAVLFKMEQLQHQCDGSLPRTPGEGADVWRHASYQGKCTVQYSSYEPCLAWFRTGLLAQLLYKFECSLTARAPSFKRDECYTFDTALPIIHSLYVPKVVFSSTQKLGFLKQF